MAAAMKRGDCVAGDVLSPIAPKLHKRPPPRRGRAYIEGKREGHRPRLQGTAIRVAPSWHSALSPYREIHAAAARGYRLSPSGTGYVGPIGV